MQEAQAHTKMIMNYTSSEGIEIVRRQFIRDQLRNPEEVLSEAEQLKLKEELHFLEIGMERRLSKQDSERTVTPSGAGRKVVELQDPNELHRTLYKPVVQTLLRNYKKALISRERLEAQIKDMETFMKPAETYITPAYGGLGGGGGDNFSQVEAAVLEPYNQLAQMRGELFRCLSTIHEMETALDQLSEYEQTILKNDYVVSKEEKIKDRLLCKLWNTGKTQFYEHKKLAIDHLARALKII